MVKVQEQLNDEAACLSLGVNSSELHEHKTPVTHVEALNIAPAL